MQTLTRVLQPLQEDKDNFCNAVRAEVKVAGLMDTTENCWSFFINKARALNLCCARTGLLGNYNV